MPAEDSAGDVETNAHVVGLNVLPDADGGHAESDLRNSQTETSPGSILDGEDPKDIQAAFTP